MKIIKLFLITNLFCLSLFAPNDLQRVREALMAEQIVTLDGEAVIVAVPKSPAAKSPTGSGRRWRIIAGRGSEEDKELKELCCAVFE